ncbi:hypothetical protein [Microbacterium sp. SORGH_AS_0888]|uniref:hypothetical protein n=1 Tax=Microbacterium sp. SORGH_AS_0888 TaxID=3041791 RepID=UPI00277FA55F|nr:hypothetical protein [Microbacterium sp. SORGH_AS_0888]MDQ1130044.1 hypothetical protein [Microbacterium sp. SORGH_AS_0888]
MEWVSEVSVGDWLRERIDDPWRTTMHDVVPRGFAAYARVFHPATRSKPVAAEWPPLPQDRHRRQWEDFAASRPEIETLPARWQDAAEAFGTTMHPLAQWGALVRSRGGDGSPSDWQQATAPDGWQFDAPLEGDLDPEALAAVIARLTGGAPTVGYAAVWAGWGGLLGHMGISPSRAILTFETPDADRQRTRDMLGAATSDPFNRPYATETWQPGVLPDEVSRGAQLELPGREHVLFRGELGVFSRSDWPTAVPWADRELAEAGFARFAQSPSILWPADRSWVLVTEVDWDSTIVGGTSEVIRALCADPAVEALPLPADARLTWDSDEINR